MFIKNYADRDFVIKYKGEQKTLEAHDVTYIDDSWINYPMIYAMFGHYIGLVEGETPIEDFLFDNQTLATAGQVYKVTGKGPGNPRVFIKGGKATFYFADTQPTSIDDMYPSQTFTDIEGVLMLDVLTNYIAFKADEGTKVIFTNLAVV